MQEQSPALPASVGSPRGGAATLRVVAAPRRKTMVRPLVALCLALAAALLALPAEAQWKWRDKGGRVQYSDLPPPAGTPDADILARPTAPAQRRTPLPVAAASAPSAPVAAASGASPLTPRTVEPELEAKRKKAEQEQAAKAKAEQDRIVAAKADNCERARTQMRSLESGIRLARVNDKGEREYLDDKQRAEESKRARDAISSDCK